MLAEEAGAQQDDLGRLDHVGGVAGLENQNAGRIVVNDGHVQRIRHYDFPVGAGNVPVVNSGGGLCRQGFHLGLGIRCRHNLQTRVKGADVFNRQCHANVVGIVDRPGQPFCDVRQGISIGYRIFVGARLAVNRQIDRPDLIHPRNVTQCHGRRCCRRCVVYHVGTRRTTSHSE